jgi:hypothetical protein
MKDKSIKILTFFGQIIGYLIVLSFAILLGYVVLKFITELFINWFYLICLLLVALPFYLAFQFESSFWGVIAICTMIIVPLFCILIYHPPIKELNIEFFPFTLKIEP